MTFWSQAVDWAGRRDEPPKQLMSHLVRLAVYLAQLDAEGLQLLEAVAPFAGSDFNFQNLVEQLERLAPENTAEVTRILALALTANKPNYDIDDRLKNLLRFLVAHGQRDAVLGFIEILRQSLPNMLEFFEEITLAA